MEVIYTNNAPEPIGPYSQAVKAGSLVFFSGQIPIDPATGTLKGDDIAAQTQQVCENIGNVLKAAGLSFDNIVKTVCYLTDASYFKDFNDIYAKYFISSPARSCVFVAGLPKGSLVEVEVTAYADA